MVKIPRISDNAVIKYLIKKEFIIIRTGSHVTLKKNHAYTSVPAGNKILKIGLQLGILVDAMIGRYEFITDHDRKITR